MAQRRLLADATRRVGLLENTVDHLNAELRGREGCAGPSSRRAQPNDRRKPSRLNLLRDLPVLRERHPEGVLLRHLVEHFGFEKAIIRLTTTAMARDGLIRWAHVKGMHEMVLTIPGEEAPVVPVTTASCQRTLELLRAHAEGDLIQVSMRTLAAETGITRAPWATMWRAPESADGRLFLVQQGRAGRPSGYSFAAVPVPLQLSPSLRRQLGELQGIRASVPRP